MKKLLYFMALGFLTACYQVSENDLFEDFNPRIVIEGKINNTNPPYYVYLSHSADYNDAIDSYPITGAQLVLTDSRGNSELLKMITSGTYVIENIVGESGVLYTLEVNTGGKSYVASDSMLDAPEIISYEINYYDEFVPEAGYFIKVLLNKKDNATHYYKLEVQLNGLLLNTYSDLIVFDDSYNMDSISYLVPYAFEPGDSVDIFVHKISEDIHKYYYQLAKLTENDFSAVQPPMQNPPTNFTNNPLGYFQISAFTKLSLVIDDK